ncbi:hypothetical protein Dimus_039144 [Dionaea muscipula]
MENSEELNHWIRHEEPSIVAIDKSCKKKIQEVDKASSIDSEETESDSEIEVLEVRKGRPMASRRSSRVADHVPIHKEKVVEKSSVKKKNTVRKMNEEQKREVEKPAPTSDHKEPRSKHKHDQDANDDVLLSEMLYKAKMTKQDAKEYEELRQQAKRKGSSGGVDPSAKKQKKTEKVTEEKKKEKVTKETFFASSDSEEDEIEIKLFQ